jgi:APA family basic amino acid/polyamine antiporter
MHLFVKKPIDVLLAQAGEEGEHTLKRGLGPTAVVALGVGAVIGAGIFVLTGQQAAVNAGPAIVLSFVLAGLTCAAAALCYAELASMIPVSGSAYTYSYATMGQFVAWIIAWDLIVEYLFAAGTVAAGWSGYLRNLVEGFGYSLPTEWVTAPYTFNGHELVATGAILNLPAMFIVGVTAAILISGISQSALFNNLVVAMKVLVVLAVIGFGFAYVQPENWTPFIPERVPPMGDEPGRYGLQGVVAAAGVIFFAYIGFEAVSTAAQEARDPQRTMPIGILGSLAICTVLYMLMALVITGLAHYSTLNSPAPVAVALQNVPELHWLRQVVNAGVVIGLGSTILTLLYGQSRIFYAMARDGLLPAAFGRINPKTRTPAIGTAITAVAAGLMGGLFPIGILGELVSVGTLLAFAVICAGVLWLRVRHPEMKRSFRTPLVWFTAPMGIAACLYLVANLGWPTLMRLFVWMAIGLVVYFGWAHWHARRFEAARAAPAE